MEIELTTAPITIVRVFMAFSLSACLVGERLFEAFLLLMNSKDCQLRRLTAKSVVGGQPARDRHHASASLEMLLASPTVHTQHPVWTTIASSPGQRSFCLIDLQRIGNKYSGETPMSMLR